MIRKANRIAALRYTHRAVCCGRTWRWPGPVPAKVQYICCCCTKEMVPEQREVRTLEACELIDEHRTRFNGESCVCGHCYGHHVVQKDVGYVPAFFLHCGSCGEELREIDEKELT